VKALAVGILGVLGFGIVFGTIAELGKPDTCPPGKERGLFLGNGPSGMRGVCLAKDEGAP
jgi:hypothetical protein